MESTPWHFYYHLCPHIAILPFYHHPQKKTETGFMAGHWTLDTGQPPDDISDAAAAHTAAIQLRSSCSSDTSRASFWQKVLPIFFNISMGAVSVPAFPIINTASKAHPLYFESPTSRKLCNLA